MKVTLELLQKYDACKPSLQAFQEIYPDGIEVLEAVKDPRITKEMMHFAARYFPLSEEELEKYREVCNIKDSKFVFSSENITNSTGVSRSKYVTNSQFVRNSNQVNNSSNIYDSKNIDTCKNIWAGKKITNSSEIISSSDISFSTQVMNSDIISWSKAILDSMLIDASSYILKGQKVINSAFCTFIKNCKNCMFCSCLEDEEYYIFNEPVGAKRFEYYMDILQAKLEDEILNFIKIDQAAHNPNKRFDFSWRPDTLFDGLSADFYGWVSQLPNFSDEKFLQIFFTDKNLKSFEI